MRRLLFHIMRNSGSQLSPPGEDSRKAKRASEIINAIFLAVFAPLAAWLCFELFLVTDGISWLFLIMGMFFFGTFLTIMIQGVVTLLHHKRNHLSSTGEKSDISGF
jgi:hypothetical protein